ncbi:hypothetical protein [Caviibacter abscessus]|uniref:hypothetical protein n=1 Tax=Caviibacter abscessus TaxID=1766719 RepID=UPI0008396E47|nr:hypothetical protein [Caviibacter abscessus]
MNKIDEFEKFLKSLGFKRRKIDDEYAMYIDLNRGSLMKGYDRFYHGVRIYLDEPEVIYIDCAKTRGVQTIKEEDFLINHNGLSTNAVEHYKQILEKIDEFRKEY